MTRFFPEDSILASPTQTLCCRIVTKRGDTIYHHGSISSDKAWWLIFRKRSNSKFGLKVCNYLIGPGEFSRSKTFKLT